MKTVTYSSMVALLLGLITPHCKADVSVTALKFRSSLVRESHFVYGLDAPIPMLAGQIQQESGWRPNVTAWDNGRGLAQFMDSTAKWVSSVYPELGAPDPYNPVWAIRAMVRLDKFNFDRVKGSNDCEKWGGALKAYNAGLGYVLQAEKSSPNPDQWFGLTEYVKTRQSPSNFEYSRTYPRKIIFQHQPTYLEWGTPVCIERDRNESTQ